ncbi:unnamed protein product, partial [Polarella glacialis]
SVLSSKKMKADQLEDLLELWGGAEKGMDDDQEDEEEEEEEPSQDKPSHKRAEQVGAPRAQASSMEAAAPTKTAAVLSDAQRQLRTVRKKLREIEELEVRELAREELSELQCQKVARKSELQQQEAEALSEAAKEENQTKVKQEKKKRKKESAAARRENATKDVRSGSCGSLQMLALMVPVGAVAAACFWNVMS